MGLVVGGSVTAKYFVKGLCGLSKQQLRTGEAGKIANMNLNPLESKGEHER